jgi:Bacterial protein of unknown function (DUF937)
MATLLESLGQTLTPDALAGIGNLMGLDTDKVSRGMGLAGPVVTGAMANRASTPQGLDGLLKMLPTDGGAGLGNILGMLRGGGASNDALSSLLGPGFGAIGSTLDRAVGFRVSPLIGLAAPVVMGLVSKAMVERKLEPGALAGMLQSEQKNFMDKSGDTARLVQTAMDAGAQAAGVKARFTPEQWTQVRLGPLAAAQMVMKASISGPVGLVKEVGAIGEVIASTKQGSAPTSLVSVAFDVEPSVDEARAMGKDLSKGTAFDVLKASAALVARNSPGDAAAYASLVTAVAQKVAEASKEGGFLGIGGTRVSDEESQAIDQVKAALGTK